MKGRGLILLKKDIRTVLRNRRELFWMIIVPLVLLAANFYLQDQSMEVKVAVVGDSNLLPSMPERLADAEKAQISVVVWCLSEEEAGRRLDAGMVHAYLVVKPRAVTLYANLSVTEGALAQALFTEVVRDSNAQLARTILADLVPSPDSVLEPIAWHVEEVSRNVTTTGQMIFSSLFVIMAVMTGMSLGQQSVSMERSKNTLVSLRKSPLTDKQIVWAKLGAGLFSTLLPLSFIVLLTAFMFPADFVKDPGFYLIIISISFNSVALGVLIGAYVRGSNEGNGLRFLLTLPAMFLAAVPVAMPLWLDKLSGIVPTLISAQIVRGYFSNAYPPAFGPLGYLMLTGFFSVQLAASFLGREE